MLKSTPSKKKKHNKIVTFSRSKSNSIESNEALVSNEIDHEHFIRILNEEKFIENEKKASES